MLKIIIERKCGKPVEFRMASYSTIYDLKKRIEDLLSMSEGQCVLISSKCKVLDGDLILEAAGLDNSDPKKKPTITCFEGAQKIGALTVIAEAEIETDYSNESLESAVTFQTVCVR
ncbi:uncharacterized protein LOC124461679 [Drosophila willistoni]|uniref:uncharacterized protein LOC124461679 n=1 Tax=Drosophila willistoni TaxID=7260 RepID=UPI001F076820|nr:uncharacterized protein LOC124461679 [Drosophila willistoni]